MRVLFVAWTENLLMNLAALNPALEFRAIITDEVDVARKILAEMNCPPNLIYPLYDLKECVEDFHYDYIICAEKPWKHDFEDVITSYDVPAEKIFSFNAAKGNFMIERSLRYFKEHAAEFEMFATGISYTEVSLDVTRFKRKLFNFARSSQDLYYNFQTAKFALSCGGGVGKISHALIGLPVYAFHYDLSKAPRSRFQMLYYLIAFNDLHNFHMPIDEYRKFFREEFLAARLPLEPFDINNPFGVKNSRLITPDKRLNGLKAADGWAKKYYSETRDENIKILDEYLTLCEENNIRPIMFLVPVTEGYLKHCSKRLREEFLYLVGAACRKHPSAVFLDGWRLRGLTESDFYDYTHMNITGAAKFSAFFNNFIEGLK